MTSNSPLIIILAAGQSKRMKSSTSKVLHSIGGLPILGHVLYTAQSLNPCAIVLVRGPDGEEVETFANSIIPDIHCCIQHERLGTAHAVLAAKEIITQYKNAPVVILVGDAPFVSKEAIQANIQALKNNAAMSVTGFSTNTPHG